MGFLPDSIDEQASINNNLQQLRFQVIFVMIVQFLKSTYQSTYQSCKINDRNISNITYWPILKSITFQI